MAVDAGAERAQSGRQGAPERWTASRSSAGSRALAAGDLDGDGVVELYVGAPGAAVDEVRGVGEVLVWPATVRGTAYPDQGLARLRRAE